MKEISSQSLMKIRDVIHGQNYINVKARLNQLLPEEYAETFATISLFPSSAVWYGDDDVEYRFYKEASDMEKEEIASWLEECRNVVCSSLADTMPFVNNLFRIPSQDQILWYRSSDGCVKVLLTQWGFENKASGSKVDVIDMLLSATRKQVQEDINIHIDYSDGAKAEDCPFVLHLFNNTKELVTDSEGNYHLGKLFINKTFTVESINGANHRDFTVVKDGQYNVVFDYYAKYTLIVENQKGERLPDYKLMVDGSMVKTDKEGQYEGELKLLPDKKLQVDANTKKYEFTLQRVPEENVFSILIEKDEPVIPPTPPEAPKPIPPTPPVPEYIKVTLLDYDGQPLPNLPFVIKTKKGDPINAETDVKGVAEIDKSMLSEKNKYKIEFKITPAYRKELDKKRKGNE